MNKALKPSPSILLVEDDEIDTEVIRRIFRKRQIANPLIHVRDGVEALGVLNEESGETAIRQPCLILLDINMPRMNGLEFLAELRKNDILKSNIVIILTTSPRNEDKLTAYKLNVAGYILKENVETLIDVISQYCRINELPGEGDFRL